MIWLVKNHLWLELYGSHSAKTIRLYLDLIVRLLGIGGLHPALFFSLAIFTHDKEDRADANKHQCTHENWSHCFVPFRFSNCDLGDWPSHSLARRVLRSKSRVRPLITPAKA